MNFELIKIVNSQWTCQFGQLTAQNSQIDQLIAQNSQIDQVINHNNLQSK